MGLAHYVSCACFDSNKCVHRLPNLVQLRMGVQCGARLRDATAANSCDHYLLLQVLLNVVKEAPGACVPHLQPLVGRIHSLWEQGQLREGEKVAMYEGVMAAAAAGGPELQVRAVTYLIVMRM